MSSSSLSAISGHTVNPRISPRGLICKNKFLGVGLFEGWDSSRPGCLFQSARAMTKSKKMAEILVDQLDGNFGLQSKEVILYSYCPVGAYSRGAYLQNDFLGGGLFERGGLFEDLRYFFSSIVLGFIEFWPY